MLGDVQFVLEREVYAFTLAAVAKGSIVDLDAGHRNCRGCDGWSFIFVLAKFDNLLTKIVGPICEIGQALGYERW